VDLFPADQLPSGKYFFHYTTRDRAFQDILPSGKLKFSSLNEMRDPLENKRWLFLGIRIQSAERAPFYRGAWMELTGRIIDQVFPGQAAPDEAEI